MSEQKKRGRKPKDAEQMQVDVISPSLAYAIRVWKGQSRDLYTNERIARVHIALQAQNLPTEGIDAETIEANL